MRLGPPGGIAALWLLLIAGTAAAQENGPAGPNLRGDGIRLGSDEREALADLRDRLREWSVREVVPVLSEGRSRLDEAMSPADLKILNDLRRQAKDVRKAMMESRRKLREAWLSESYDDVKELRSRIGELKKQRIDIGNLLVPLAIEYRTTLEEIVSRIRPHITGWKKERKTIVDAWKAEQSGEAGRTFERFAHYRKGLVNLIPADKRRGLRLAAFMLWDGSVPEGEEVPTSLEPELR